MNHSKYKAVIFDLDGTLIDSMHIWRQVDKEFLGKRGIEVPSDLFEHLPLGNSYIQTAQYFKDRFNLPDSVESIMQEWTNEVCWHYEHDIGLKDGARDLIEWLSGKEIIIGLGTSNSYDLAVSALSQHNLLHHFKTIITGCQELRGKPFPDIYLKAALEINAKPFECIVIEDTLSGIRAARNAGMHAIAIHDPDADEHRELIKAEADYHAGNYFDLLEYIKSIL